MTTRRVFAALAVAASTAVAGLSAAPARDKFITVASTTSTDQSGLFADLLPAFTRETGITVRVVALGTGQALDVGRRGDADVVLVHDQAAEEKFVAEGAGGPRHQVMYNDFIIVGPAADPAQVAGLTDVTAALKRIGAAKTPFVSRGDRSGTHAAELRYWQGAGVDVNAGKGGWYREVGQGMGPALNIAAASDAYILADRGAWLNFRNRASLAILVEGDVKLVNQYGVMLVNPQKHPHVKADLGKIFVDWLIGAKGQKAIADYKINGEQLFFGNAAQRS